MVRPVAHPHGRRQPNRGGTTVALVATYPFEPLRAMSHSLAKTSSPTMPGLSPPPRSPRSARTRKTPAGSDPADRHNRCPQPLVLRAQRGDRKAFSTLWELYAPTVQGILLAMVPDAEADDLTQEVAVAAFKALPSLRKQSSFPAWLCTIARNMGRDALAIRRRSPERSLEEACAEDIEAPSQGDQTVADEILAQIRSLPECHREPLMLRLLLELTGPEIAEQTGMTEGSVRVNLCRGMKLLRARLKDWH